MKNNQIKIRNSNKYFVFASKHPKKAECLRENVATLWHNIKIKNLNASKNKILDLKKSINEITFLYLL